MSERLKQFADDYASLPPDDFLSVADECRSLAINLLDVRFMVLGECFRISSAFWGPGESGGVDVGFAMELRTLWERYVAGVLRAFSEEEGTAVALALREELVVLGGTDPLRGA